jgi:hypothetical protein
LRLGGGTAGTLRGFCARAHNRRMMILGVAAVRPLREVAETGLGVVLALVPLGLWIAWSPGVLFAVLVTGGVCAALLIALSALRDEPTDEDGSAQHD